MILGSYLAKYVAGKYTAKHVVRVSYGWMGLMAIINIIVCYTQPTSVIANILPVALFNVGMAMCTPVLSIAALDRHKKIRGTAASGQAFMQMLLSTVSAGIIVPLVWYAPVGLALAMAAYILLGLISVATTELWHST
jgi:DHA1 family bicyclomycin/chloramphenicol resistance-like MFS transporter